MFFRMPVRLLWWGFLISVSLSFFTGCSSEHYKSEADKEVYKIIDSKWDDKFGEKADYYIGDAVSAPNDVEANLVRPASVLRLADAVAIATTNNRNYLNQKENLYLSALSLTQVRHDFVRQWFGTIDGGYTKTATDEKMDAGGDFGFNQMLADGGQISMAIALDWSRFLTGAPGTSLGSVLSATITQPLLRGAGRKIAQENLTQAERNVLYEIRSFNRYRKTFVVSIITDYYNVLQRKDGVINAENNYKRVVESEKRLAMLAEAGRQPEFEVDQARQNVLSAKDGLVRAEQNYKQLLDEFKIKLALTTDADISLDPNELRALEKLGADKPDYDLNAAVEMALVSRLDLANSADRIDDSLRKVLVAADSLGAELNLVGSLGVGSTGKTNYSKLRFNDGTYGFGFEADLPFDRNAERNAYRQSLISLDRQQRQYDNDSDEVKLDVRQAYRQLQEAAQRYNIQNNSLELAKKRVESTTLLMEAGRSTTRDLLDAQDSLLLAQNNLTDALVSYATAKLRFFRDIGLLQVQPDGMWSVDKNG